MPNEEQAKEDEVKPMTLSDLSLEDLKEMAKERDIKNSGKMKKEDLIKALEDYEEEDE